jgi:methyltransferase family protein
LRRPFFLLLSAEVAPTPTTFSSTHVRRQRERHTRTDGYGRHRHLYLHGAMRRLAAELREGDAAAPLSWLDYGCGKGEFIEQIRPLGLFATIVGYDPAIETFKTRPEGRYHLVTCLDVLDVVEPRFLAAVIGDVAALTGGLALFDCLTRPKPGTLKPHPPFYWSYLVVQHMDMRQTHVEYPGMEGFERAIIIAAPRTSL